MKIKARVAFLLAVLMMLSPLSAFARVELPDPTKNIDDDIEIEEPEIPEVRTQADKVKEVEKDLEEDYTEPVTQVVNDNPATDEEKLEMSEDLEPEKIVTRGGSSTGGSGSGGGSSGGSGWGYVGPIKNPVQIKKYTTEVDEKTGEKVQKPMKVSFKITNTSNGEKHIVITNEEGISQVIFLAQFNKYKLAESIAEGTKDTNKYTPEQLREIFKKLQAEGYVEEDAKLDIFCKEGEQPRERVNTVNPEKINVDVTPGGPIVGPVVPGGKPVPDPGPVEPVEPVEPGEGEPPHPGMIQPNKNDKFLKGDKVESSAYEYENLEKKTFVEFIDSTEYPDIVKGTVKVLITYGRFSGAVVNPDGSRKDTHYDTYGDRKDEFVFEDVTKEELEKIDQAKIRDFAVKRLANWYGKGEIKGGNQGFSYRVVYSKGSEVYEVEELRTDTNQNYKLKKFYLEDYSVPKKDKDWKEGDKLTKVFMGESKDDISNKPSSYVIPKPIVRDDPDIPTPPPKAPSGLDISDENIPAPVRGGSSGGGGGGGSSAGGSGSFSSDDGTPPGTPVFEIENELFKFETKATNPTNGEKKVEKGPKTTIVDRVEYDGLSVGKEYKFIGKVYRKTADGVEKDPVATTTYDVGMLKDTKGGTDIKFTFDSSKYNDGDEFVILYDIIEDGNKAGYEDNINNKDQSFTIEGGQTPPPPGETPPPEEETPPPEEETPPPEKEVPPPDREVPPPDREVPPPQTLLPPPKVEIPPEKEIPEVEEVVQIEKVEVKEPTPEYVAPKTYDAGMGISIIAAVMSGAGLLFLKKKR